MDTAATEADFSEQLALWVELRVAWQAWSVGSSPTIALSAGANAYFGRFCHAAFCRSLSSEMAKPGTPGAAGGKQWEAWDWTLRFLCEPRKVARTCRMDWILDHVFLPDGSVQWPDNPGKCVNTLRKGLAAVIRNVRAEHIREITVMKGKIPIAPLDKPLQDRDGGSDGTTLGDLVPAGCGEPGATVDAESEALGEELGAAYFSGESMDEKARLALVLRMHGISAADPRVRVKAGIGKSVLFDAGRKAAAAFCRWVAEELDGEDGTVVWGAQVAGFREILRRSDQWARSESWLGPLLKQQEQSAVDVAEGR